MKRASCLQWQGDRIRSSWHSFNCESAEHVGHMSCAPVHQGRYKLPFSFSVATLTENIKILSDSCKEPESAFLEAQTSDALIQRVFF